MCKCVFTNLQNTNLIEGNLHQHQAPGVSERVLHHYYYGIFNNEYNESKVNISDIE